MNVHGRTQKAIEQIRRYSSIEANRLQEPEDQHPQSLQDVLLQPIANDDHLESNIFSSIIPVYAELRGLHI